MSAPPPQPYYCEENVWQAARVAVDEGAAGPVEAVFLTNEARRCAVWSQRAAPEPGTPVLWDYHVVLRVGPAILDADCVAGAHLPAAAWLAASFPLGEAVPRRFLPRFRRVPAAVFLSRFASDRRHMRRTGGRYVKPPPPWPPIVAPDGAVHTLPAFLDPHDATLPPWESLGAFAAALLATPA